MTSRRWSFPVRCAVLLVLVLLAPQVRHRLEATMTAQMLVQLPLLVAAGWLLSLAIPARLRARADRWNRSGIAGLALMTPVSLFWMLPGFQFVADKAYNWVAKNRYRWNRKVHCDGDVCSMH